MFDANEFDPNKEIANNLDISLQDAYGRLIAASNNNSLAIIAPVFGESGDFSQFQALTDAWSLGDFSQLPIIQILPSASMNGANGGFSKKNHTIYLSSDYVSHASGDRDSLTGLTGTLLEEIGHFVDSLINPGSDTPGDEGELFSANLMGLSLSPQEKARIVQENDHSFVTVNGQIIPVEQSLPDLAGNTLATARVITAGATSTTFTDFVGGSDRDDYYKFTLANGGNLAVNLTGLSADASLRLLDSAGVFVTGSFNAGSANDSFQRLLLAGTYYVQVSAGVKADFSGFTDTNYSLSLQATPLPVNPIDNAGNTLSTARAITVTSTTATFNDSVWNLDTDDYYKFTLANGGNLTANLTGLAADASLRLLDSAGVFVTGSFNAGSANDSFQRLLLAGTYYVQVSAGVKADFSGFTDTNYSLSLQATPLPVNPIDNAGNTLSTARAITVTSTTATFNDSVWNLDTDDYYKFTLANGGNLTANLTGLAADANLRLLDSTGVFIDGSFNTGSANDNFQRLLLAGTYYVKVSAGVKPDFSGFTDTNYSLGLALASSQVLPTITIAATDASAGETATGVTTNPGSFTLTRTGNVTQALTVNYTIGGTGTKGTDYNNLTGTVSFAAGSATALVNITPIDDTLAEGNETVILTLAAGTGYTVGTANTGTVTIADNEVVLPTITIAATDGSAGETATGVTANPGSFTLTRTGNLTQALTVNYTIGGTGTKGTDYNNLTGTVSFAAGSATALVNITPIDDLIFEGNETVILTISSSTTYALGADTFSTIVINNTDPKGLADFLWDKGSTLDKIVLNLNNRGFDLLTIFDSLKWGVTKSNNTNPSYTEVAEALWVTESIDDARMLADLLWDEGASQGQIGQAMKYIGFSLETIADSVKRGVTTSSGTSLNDIDVAIALWNSGYTASNGLNSNKLADLLWDVGANPIAIGQAMKYLGLSLEIIAGATKWGITKADGTNLDYHQVAEALWNSGYSFGSRKLADLLWDNSASQQKIGQVFEYLDLSLEDIVDAVKWGITQTDGTNLNYIDAAIAVWNSGYGLDTRKLADLLWDEGASQQQIGQIFKYFNWDLETIADAMDDGVTKSDGTKLNYTDVAIALWNSGYTGTDGLNSSKLADLLWDEGASQAQIGQAMKYLGFSLAIIANAVDDGVTKSDGTSPNYTDVAIALWNSGYTGADGLNTRKLADLLWDEGGDQKAIGQAMKYLGLSLETIADAVKWGVTKSDGTNLNYNSVAEALWNSGHSIDSRKLADLLWDASASQSTIGQAMKYLGLSLEAIADAMDNGVTNGGGSDFSYIDVAIAIWNSGYGFTYRKLADLLWDEGASQQQVGQAFKYLGLSLEDIADAVKWGVTQSNGTNLNYNSVALALWNSGYSFNARKLADLLWDESASQQQIGQAFKYLSLSLETIADSVKWGVTNSDGTNLNYNSVALALWNSGYSFNARKLADLLWDEGASQQQIGQAFKYLALSLETIADSVKWGATKSDGTNLNYTDAALALWNSGYSFNARKLADLLWDENASQKQIGQAFKYLALSLETIADSVKWGATKSDGTNLNYSSVAEALWNSGYNLDSRKLADLLWDEGADQSTIGQTLRYLGMSNEVIGDAVKRGVTHNGYYLGYVDAAIAVWNSGSQPSDYRIAVITYSLGGGGGDVYDAIRAIGGSHGRASWLSIQAYVKEYIINPFFEAVFGAIPGSAAVVNGISDVGNSIIDSAGQIIDSTADSLKDFYEDNQQAIDLVLLPYTLPAAIILNTVEAVKQGDVEVIVDGLKKIPVLGTAVGVIEGVVNAALGNEKETLISAIDSALAFYGGSNVVTPNMVEFAVDIFWELKDSDYQGAISASLENLGMQKTVSDLFVAVSWSVAVDPDWEKAMNAALTKIGFNNASSFVTMAWDIIDQNYKEALKTGLQIVGLSKLGIDQAKADAFLNVAVAIRDGKPTQAADILIALSGNNQQVIQSSWIKDLKDGNLANDRQAIQLGLSNFGFQNVTQWVDTIWAVKDGKYLDALSAVLTLGNFTDGQDWVKIIDNLQKQNYDEALSIAFKLADFQDGQSLADAAVAVKKGDYVEAFYESLNLIEGGRDLADAFKYLIEFDLQEFVTSMIGAAPLLLKFLV